MANLSTSSSFPLQTQSDLPFPDTNMLAGSKRKRAPAPPKFYAVRAGKQPGIYHSWPECLAQVKGHPKAMFKAFTTLTEAQSYLHPGGSSNAGGTSGKWYGVQIGRTPGVYTDYEDVLDQVTGWKGARHRVFKSRIEAEQWVAEREQMPQGDTGDEEAQPAAKKAKPTKPRKSTGPVGSSTTSITATATKDSDPLRHSPAFFSGGEYAAGEAPLGEGVEDGFDTAIVLDPAASAMRYRSRAERERTTYRAARPVAAAPIRIYTDGSALGNGRVGALAGVGVFFGPGDGRNVSEPLPGTKQTNQRAELTAIVRALELAPRDRRVVVVSDSKYAIDCVTDWFANWRRNGWVNASRKPVENRDLVQKVLELLEERLRLNKHRMSAEEVAAAEAAMTTTSSNKRAHWDRGPGGVRFEWVKGHDKDEGNNAADHLAVAGARTAQELHAMVDLDD